MAMSEEMINIIGKVLIVLIVILVLAFVINNMTGGVLVRLLVSNILFFLPFQTLTTTLTKAIPV